MTHPSHSDRAKDLIDGKSDKDGFMLGDMHYHEQIVVLTKAFQAVEEETIERCAKVADRLHRRTDEFREDQKPVLKSYVYFDDVSQAIRALLNKGETK